ncbi:type II toxin-antitoxin system VapC family toxin [Bosea sp. PAMC 26642]|uniref:type II toxin-antitoxin system VapC family toxin n=1 Tax=Bosea sp. (strain PAMC 26642) TaxID=1792307 RepID=UPI0007703757|nr:type II toxin-antitoxin system VapC family toxin [Bosea sp. PAMC 26642]AMJ60323.1 transcriptional regulator [Bosea sp. PAMC 26642]
MKRYLLDTNIISDLIRNPQGKAARRIADIGDRAVFTSIIVAAELRYGVEKKGSVRLRDAVEAILGEIEAAPFDEPASIAYGALRASLEVGGQPIGGNDMLIAAQALALQATLVTANTSEFARVDDLKLENWLA